MTRGIRFVKMSGAGNDFVVLDAEEAARVPVPPERWVPSVCARRTAVGADGVLVVEPVDARRIELRYFNADGSVAFCGNGTRCAARFAVWRRFTGRSLVVGTAAGPVPSEVTGDRVRLELPAPVDGGALELDVGGTTVRGRLVAAGVPHFVCRTERLDSGEFERWGPSVRRHPSLGEAGANFDLVVRLAADRLRIRTFERGVEGETLACGSGAVAAALAHRIEGGAGCVEIVPASGVLLRVELPGPADRPELAVLEGDARLVYEGRTLVPEL